MAATNIELKIDLKDEIIISESNQDRFDLVVGELEEILMDEEFNRFQTHFINQYCELFEPGPENKLEYMDLFHKYVLLIH